MEHLRSGLLDEETAISREVIGILKSALKKETSFVEAKEKLVSLLALNDPTLPTKDVMAIQVVIDEEEDVGEKFRLAYQYFEMTRRMKKLCQAALPIFNMCEAAKKQGGNAQ